jgi:hypothetical protein
MGEVGRSEGPVDDGRFAEYAAWSHAPAPGDPASPCPDANRLAGFAEGRLLEAEVEALSAHVATCDACRTLVADVARAWTPGVCSAPARPARRRRAWIAPFAAAAALLIAATVVLVAGPRDTREIALASARDLAAARPDLFAGFEPLRSGRSAAPAPMRGAPALFAPAGVVTETRPAFRWEPAPGVTRWTVTLRTSEGDRIWSAESDAPSLEFPARETDLAPGARYIWEASGVGPLGVERSRRAFDVASDDERRAFDEASREVERIVPERIRALVLAQFALHRGLYGVAETQAERYLRDAPADAFGAETLAAARRAVGRPTDGR